MIDDLIKIQLKFCIKKIFEFMYKSNFFRNLYLKFEIIISEIVEFNINKKNCFIYFFILT